MADNDGQGWHGDSEGHAEAARGNDVNDSNSGSSQDSGQGWHGDPEGHAEAAEKGQSGGLLNEIKETFSGSTDETESSDGRGWHGDSEGHSEAAQKGQE